MKKRVTPISTALPRSSVNPVYQLKEEMTQSEGIRGLSAEARKRSSVQSGDRESVAKAQRDDSIRR